MACQAPVICFDEGAIRDMAIDGETALIIKENKYPEISSLIRNLLNDPNLAKRLVYNAYAHIQQFSWENVVNKLEKFLK